MQKILLFLIVVFFMFPINAFAAGITSSEYSAADDTYYVYMDTSGADSFTITQDATGTTWNYDVVDGDDYTTLTCNGSFTYTFYSGNSVIATETVTASGIIEQNSNCEGTSDGNGNNNCGCIFNTPGWQDYMDKMDDVISVIPPAPDWDSVADTFKDSIVPSLVGEVENMLGSPPGEMSAPPYPPPLDDGNLQEPTGQEANGLEGFDANDIKDNAPDIEVREDESGGFDINDPLESMPEQEIFVPSEPENPAPSEPEEPENIAPEPTEPENVAPAPSEPENVAPSPEEPENVAPTPGEGENTAPTPSEGNNTAPIPSEDGTVAPTPGEPDNAFPVPGPNTDDYPMP
ncbi:hypothetical protein MUN88_14210 [Gracilibacillus caseinilyticus]|uniref:Uncharacterized protein n=1 Tax=Gracilibacillus caseinilyticus TaxID=2932256 RepID=A0ABY4ET19_9BACI|nr:hypothetical protein [Gracilibacillus caseinilyticus]UOQ47221.1 hypothetical protein MUN88_14210 [Gracilibacillus caseinilyticus]